MQSGSIIKYIKNCKLLLEKSTKLSWYGHQMVNGRVSGHPIVRAIIFVHGVIVIEMILVYTGFNPEWNV